MRRKLAIVVGLAVSAAFLWLALRNADFAAIGTALSMADPWLAVPFLASLFLFYGLKSGRWALLLSPVAAVRGRQLFPAVMIGYAGTAILPMQLGELVRTYIAARQHALPIGVVLTSIVMERIFDLLTILLLLAMVFAAGNSTPRALTNAGYTIGILTIAGLAVAMFFVLRREQAFRLANVVLRPLPGALREAIIRHGEVATDGLRSLADPALVARIAGNSLLQWGLMGLCVWASLAALSVEVPVAGVTLVLVATIIGISLPTSPGYVGNIQLAFVVALQPFGVPAEQALAASIFYHVLAYVSVLLTGAAYAHRLGFGALELRRQANSSTIESS